ncbi:hypothetical protein NE237_028679 [Protea cynaroides]|uniref:Tf2-1-like SH3-like domain-containing protein n=1 Tax=Protea cynaroides TaxID=273540 RepID=A0A9Q0GPT4_9MAGN|nr:hypothetical protein NE237_028679 [Protea cynaroides]
MVVPTIALYASPPSSVCSTPHPYQVNSHASSDYELNPRPSSSSSTSTSSGQKPIVGGLSCLFSSPSVKHASSFSGGGDELGSLWHERGDELSSSFSYSPYSSLSSSLKCRDQSPVSVFQGPFSCSSAGVASSRSPPMRIARERNGDLHIQASYRTGSNGLFNGLVRNALGSCLDYDPSSFPIPAGGGDSSVALVDEFAFNMEDNFVETSCEPYAKELLLGAQLRHKIFYDDLVVKAFYEAEKAHKGQMRASGDPYLQHCIETAVLLATVGANSTVVAAGLLHDTLDDSFMTYDYILQTFGTGVADLVEGLKQKGRDPQVYYSHYQNLHGSGIVSPWISRGNVAYQLALPPSMSSVHDVFHVSLLKKYVTDSSHILTADPPDLTEDLTLVQQLRTKDIHYVKVHWRSQNLPSNPIFEFRDDIHRN